MTGSVRHHADELMDLMLQAHPVIAWSHLGLSGYDDRMDDLSQEADQAYAARMTAARGRLLALDADHLTAADSITRAAGLSLADGELAEVAVGAVGYSVGPMGQGPAAVLAVASRSTPADAEQAEAYLARTVDYARYLDQHLERLRAGAAAGRPLVTRSRGVALGMVDTYLANRSSDALADLIPPAGWDRATEWSDRLRREVDERVRPALARWRDGVASLPVRPDEHCGMVHLPGGAGDYERLVQRHTTLPVSAEQVHAQGSALVERLQAQMAELGAQLGLTGFDAVRMAVRGSSSGVTPAQLQERSLATLARAETVVPAVFPAPAPPACRVEPMSAHLAVAGMPPHYTPPSQDGSRVGTYWFNDQRPSVGAGWDLEATVFHEAVPGHHLQVSRALAASGLPAVQSLGLVTAYIEGWALYAEELAEELGLYSGPEALLGALAARLARASRLVIDTGIHALGWSREQAIAWFGGATALTDAFVESEVDRCIAHPGQVLGYTVGCVEITRLRDDARARLGASFALPGFHGAVLDSGTLPLPALEAAVETWVHREGHGA